MAPSYLTELLNKYVPKEKTCVPIMPCLCMYPGQN